MPNIFLCENYSTLFIYIISVVSICNYFLKLIFIGVQFLLYSTVNQLHTYIYPLFLRFFSHTGHYRVLSRVPCAIQQVLISYLFYIQQCVYVNPNLPIYPSPSPPFPLGSHKFVIYVCVSIPALQIGSSVPFFQIPHVCINIQYLFFSF